MTAALTSCCPGHLTREEQAWLLRERRTIYRQAETALQRIRHRRRHAWLVRLLAARARSCK